MSTREPSRPPRSIEEIDREAETLGVDVRTAIITAHSHRALIAVLSGDKEAARRTLNRLDRDRLVQLENALADVGRLAFETRKAKAEETQR